MEHCVGVGLEILLKAMNQARHNRLVSFWRPAGSFSP